MSDQISEIKENIPFWKIVIPYIVLGMGVVLVTGAGSWDITNHILNKPESFFAEPHIILYAGVIVSISGFIGLFLPIKNKNIFNLKFPKLFSGLGIFLLIIAGPLDFWWHDTYGLDGLLSPTHLVLMTGMLFTSIASVIGIIRIENKLKRKTGVILQGLIFTGVWFSHTGFAHSFSLPFSKTDYFDFNPEPTFAAVFATIVYPIVMAFILISSSKVNPGRFGYLSTTGAFYILIMILSALLPNPVLVDAVPFYLLNLVPFVLADVIINKSKIKKSHYIAGAMIGSSFIFSYFPLITYTYNEVMFHRLVWPSMIPLIYSEFIVVIFPLLIACGAVSSVIGTLIAVKVSRRIIL